MIDLFVDYAIILGWITVMTAIIFGVMALVWALIWLEEKIVVKNEKDVFKKMLIPVAKIPWFLWRCFVVLLVVIFLVPFYLAAYYIAEVICITKAGYRRGRLDGNYYWL